MEFDPIGEISGIGEDFVDDHRASGDEGVVVGRIGVACSHVGAGAVRVG